MLRRLVFPWLMLLMAAVPAAEDADGAVLLARLEELNETAARLVQKARSAQAEATPFRIDVTLYREHLRSLMLANREIGEEKHRIPQGILVNMVRMSALLNSAAECKTGRYIVCPPDLMSRLTSQQRVLSKDLESLNAAAGGPD